MNHNFLAIGIAILLLCNWLSGCNTRYNIEINVDDRFVGTWEGKDDSGDNLTIIFSSGGTFNTNLGEKGEYKITDEKLEMIVMTGDLKAVITYNYSFLNNNATLSLTELGVNETIVYTRFLEYQL